MFEIKLTCYDYGNPNPHVEQVDIKFNTRQMAELVMYRDIVDELNSLNGIGDDGNFPERRFTVLMDGGDHCATIVCWDGEDYTPVTHYDIVEV